jgi:pilus assembly protein CpaC
MSNSRMRAPARTHRTRALAALLAAAAALALAGGESPAQSPRPGPGGRQFSPAASPEPLETAHRSVLRLAPGQGEQITRRVSIGVDKSMLIEVPVDLSNVLVSNPEVIDAIVQTNRRVYLLAKDVGEANAFFFGPDGRKVLLLEVTVSRDLATLSEMLHRLIPGAKIRAEMAGEHVVLSGSVISPQDATRAADLAGRFLKKKENVVNMLTTASREQVLLKVQVAEMQRDVIRRLGVDMPGVVAGGGGFTVSHVLRNAFPVTSPLVPAAIPGPIGTVPAVAAGRATQFSWEHGDRSVTALVQALERAGALKTLAEPNLTAISGETAKFLAGGEFPIPISQQDNKVTVEYKQFGVNVSFKPVVLGDGRISLTLSAEVSEISSEASVTIGTISVPGLKVRRAETTLELPSGGTLAMAGLLSDDTRQSAEGVPGLKNLPVLGALFRSNDYRRRETELVILVTPFIATHAARREVARPTDGLMPQSELKELFYGHVNRVYGRGEAPPHQPYHGDFGYIIDYPDPGVKG